MSAAAWDERSLLLEHSGPWTVEEFLQLPQDAYRYELLDGALLMSPGPSGPHQRALKHVTTLLDAVTPDDWDVLPEPNVKFSRSSLLRPDVAILMQEAYGVVFEPADIALAVEVMSPSSVSNDRILKPGIYGNAGIPWYIRVELDSLRAPEVFVYRLKEDTYVEHTRAAAGQTLRLDEPVTLSFDPVVLRQRRVQAEG